LNNPPSRYTASYAWKTYVPSQYESLTTAKKTKEFVLSDLEEYSRDIKMANTHEESRIIIGDTSLEASMIQRMSPSQKTEDSVKTSLQGSRPFSIEKQNLNSVAENDYKLLVDKIHELYQKDEEREKVFLQLYNC
jgi:hypothetical protein